MNRSRAEKLLLMKASKQDRLGSPWGNCVEACIATLLGIPVSQVPDPRRSVATDEEALAVLPERVTALSDWLHARYGLAAVAGEGASPPGARLLASGVPLFWVASGPSERGLQHAVIYSNLTLLWDPHPDETGLVRVTGWTVLAPCGPLWTRLR